ncbi:MAG: hypothetical protein JWP78_3142 [Mucilaginibacter sp.]|nr:hypothetical protein [Mucilaginibacter sp.]
MYLYGKHLPYFIPQSAGGGTGSGTAFPCRKKQEIFFVTQRAIRRNYRQTLLAVFNQLFYQ